jgi:hypothetical protein
VSGRAPIGGEIATIRRRLSEMLHEAEHGRLTFEDMVAAVEAVRFEVDSIQRKATGVATLPVLTLAEIGEAARQQRAMRQHRAHFEALRESRCRLIEQMEESEDAR